MLQTLTGPTSRTKATISPKAVLPSDRTLPKSITKDWGKSGRIRDLSWFPSSCACRELVISWLKNAMTTTSGLSSSINSKEMCACGIATVRMASPSSPSKHPLEKYGEADGQFWMQRSCRDVEISARPMPIGVPPWRQRGRCTGLHMAPLRDGTEEIPRYDRPLSLRQYEGRRTRRPGDSVRR